MVKKEEEEEEEKPSKKKKKKKAGEFQDVLAATSKVMAEVLNLHDGQQAGVSLFFFSKKVFFIKNCLFEKSYHFPSIYSSTSSTQTPRRGPPSPPGSAATTRMG